MTDTAKKTSGKRKLKSAPRAKPTVEDWLARGKEGPRLQCTARHLPVKGISLQAMAQALVDKGIVPPPLDSERGKKKAEDVSSVPSSNAQSGC